MDDFWGWLQSGNLTQLLAAAGHTTIAADLERLLIVGESAGSLDLLRHQIPID